MGQLLLKEITGRGSWSGVIYSWQSGQILSGLLEQVRLCHDFNGSFQGFPVTEATLFQVPNPVQGILELQAPLRATMRDNLKDAITGLAHGPFAV